MIRLKEPFVYLSPNTRVRFVWDLWSSSKYEVPPQEKGRLGLVVCKAAGLDVWGYSDEVVEDHVIRLMGAGVSYVYIWTHRTEGCLLWGAMGTDRPILTDPCRVLTLQRNNGFFPSRRWSQVILDAWVVVAPLEVTPAAPSDFLWELL